ncbi:MAG: AraC family transcriptional regulator [Solimonas sp.]
MNLHAANTTRLAGFRSNARSAREIAHADTLRGFPELVRQLGGDPHSLLTRHGIDPAAIRQPGAVVDYRSRVRVMERAAQELACADFGLRLATAQSGRPEIGPIGVVMKNCATLGEAVNFWVRHNYAYTRATRARIETDRTQEQVSVKLEYLIKGVTDRRQAVEQGLLLGTLNVAKMTGGAVRPRKVLFSHEPHSPLKTYRNYFGCDVSFGEREDGMVLNTRDLSCPVANADPTIYEIATSFLEDRFPETEPPLDAKVRSVISQQLRNKDCTIERVAARLYLHPRTLQRRLRDKGLSFESIKDEIRREAAMRYIGEGGISMKRLAEILGYAETSIVSRNFHRWFSATPHELIHRQRSAVAV